VRTRPKFAPSKPAKRCDTVRSLASRIRARAVVQHSIACSLVEPNANSEFAIILPR
jgi:hypothetical protein